VTNTVVPSVRPQAHHGRERLNDGIVTPVVLLAIAGATSGEELAGAPGFWAALPSWASAWSSASGLGLGGGMVVAAGTRSRMGGRGLRRIAVLALALAAYAAAVAVHGNGFVAAFCGGLAFGAVAPPRTGRNWCSIEQTGGLVSAARLAHVRRAVSVSIILERTNLLTVLYAVLA
jgi:NhaP-type Na+/H+ or K+/H+ antiporter